MLANRLACARVLLNLPLCAMRPCMRTTCNLNSQACCAKLRARPLPMQMIHGDQNASGVSGLGGDVNRLMPQEVGPRLLCLYMYPGEHQHKALSAVCHIHSVGHQH